ncbi:MAG: type II secretion system F family protein [Microbacteriaceae bacterium]
MAEEKTFAYAAVDANGKTVNGRVEARNEQGALQKLRSSGVMPTSIEENSGGTGLNREISLPSFFDARVKPKDLAVMTRQMSTMIAAGLSIVRTLTIIAEQTPNKKLQATMRAVHAEVETGTSLSEAFGMHPLIFPRLMIHLIRAGETGGFLDKSLDSVAVNLETEVKLTSTIKSALTYPVAVLVIAVVAVFAMLIFIVPVFQGMFKSFGGELPVMTQVLVTLSENMIWLVPLTVVIVVTSIILWRRFKHTDAVRSKADTILLKLPVFGELLQKVAIARFSRNFATMTGAGVPILQALNIVGDTSGNYVIERACERVQDSVRQGRSIAAPLAEEAVFPSMVVQMIAVGEDSGALETMLDKVADFYEAEVQATAESLTALIEPIMIVVIGGILGGMIVALYMPVFSIFGQIK